MKRKKLTGNMGLMGPLGQLGELRRLRRLGRLRPLRVLGILGILALACCSEDEQQQGQRVTLELMPYTQSFVEVEPLATRAWTPPTGYFLYTSSQQFVNQDMLGDKSIGIFLTQDDNEPLEGTFFYNGTSWRSSVDIVNAGDYYLYGFIPSVSATIAPNTTYSEGAVLTMQAPTVSSNDVSVVVGAKEGTRGIYDPTTTAQTVTGLQTGKYLTHVYAAGDANNKNYIFLLFDHLFPALRISMQVYGTYNDLRTIYVKEVRMKAFDSNGNAIKKNMEVTVKMKATDDGSSPITDIVYSTVTTGPDSDVQLYKADGQGMELTTSASNFFGSFAPTNIDKIALVTRYDVYDKKGNLIREDCIAENRIEVTTLSSGVAIKRNNIYTINLRVIPTYLYVLSEPDLDNPTITIQ